MQNPDVLQNWLLGLDRRWYALLVGLTIGIVGAGIGLAVTLVGPVITAGGVIGALAGLYVLTSISAALYGLIAVLFLLPFGTLPFQLVFTPTLLDATIGAFILVYLFQWMSGRRRNINLTPVHLLLLVYILWLLLTFILGLRYAPPTSNILRQFAETLLSISLVFILVDLLRDPILLRRLVLVVLLAIGIEAVIVLGLYALPDDTATRLLQLLTRIGYPGSGVIRYIESNPALAERAIGTWVDPNTLGGAFAIAATMIAPQVFARKPVLRYRWLTAIVLAVVAAGLFLTYSRTSMAAFGIGLSLIAIARYRRLLAILVVVGALVLLLPQFQGYVERFLDAFTAGDLATQMRIGEYGDALNLISQYPFFGVGFTGTPSINLYTDVASMYLIMANQIGLIGVAIYLMTMFAVLIYGFSAWKFARQDDDLVAIHLGFHCALVAALINGIGDLYYFRIDFQASITLFWLVVALALASSRIAIERHEFYASRSAKLSKSTIDN
jgi:polysaccharide biosynthesis protein PslJ